MAFIQPCFIEKNTPELRAKLVDLGYRYEKYTSYLSFRKGKPIGGKEIINRHLIVCKGRFYQKRFKDNTGIHNCDKNEDLFLAIAALRDDTDMNQWFVTNKGEWFLSMYDSQYTHLCKRTIDGIDIGERTAHKATVQELIEHFK